MVTEEVVARTTKVAPAKRRSFVFRANDLILFHMEDSD